MAFELAGSSNLLGLRREPARIHWPNEKRPCDSLGGVAWPFSLREKSGDTYFHAGMHYHRLEKLDFCVRDGNRYDLFDIVTGKSCYGLFTRRSFVWLLIGSRQSWFFSTHISLVSIEEAGAFRRECEISVVKLSSVSTGKLNTLPCLHIQPINLIVYQGTLALKSATKPYLGEGFTLRCFQRLSFP